MARASHCQGDMAGTCVRYWPGHELLCVCPLLYVCLKQLNIEFSGHFSVPLVLRRKELLRAWYKITAHLTMLTLTIFEKNFAILRRTLKALKNLDSLSWRL